ncbi:hypothetical protein IFR05_004578 [Cadophora sp. M221]|nr:hypothetical protein IFR05_004578 [Cadophora sp. M221]
MSTQPSIPASPPPGKDPPPPGTSPALHSVTNLDTKSRDSNTDPSMKPETESENTTRNPSPESARKTSLSLQTDTDARAMPPPPTPSSKPRPVITTRHPSSSNTNMNANNPAFSPSLAQSTSQNTALQDQPETETGGEVGVERERPPFTPFFTLVNDLSGGEQSTHHPSQVHYIFADDDVSEVLTGALLRAMDGDPDRAPDGDGEEGEVEVGDEEEGEGEGETSSGSSATFRRDGTRVRSERSRARLKLRQRDKQRGAGATGREERVVIVDVNESGDAVTGVSSLSPSWQVISAEIGKAPTWDKDGAESEGGRGELAGGLMLRIEGVGLDCGEPAGAGVGVGLGVGVGVGVSGKGKGKEREGDAGSANANASGSGMGEEEMQALMEGFDRKMGMLRRIVQRGSRESLVDGEKS